MARLSKISNAESEYIFWCPGCEEYHCFDKRWTFNGDFDKPTFSPSLLYPGRCHLFLKEGKLQFLSDCKHKLAGQIVDLPEEPV